MVSGVLVLRFCRCNCGLEQHDGGHWGALGLQDVYSSRAQCSYWSAEAVGYRLYLDNAMQGTGSMPERLEAAHRHIFLHVASLLGSLCMACDCEVSKSVKCQRLTFICVPLSCIVIAVACCIKLLALKYYSRVLTWLTISSSSPTLPLEVWGTGRECDSAWAENPCHTHAPSASKYVRGHPTSVATHFS